MFNQTFRTRGNYVNPLTKEVKDNCGELDENRKKEKMAFVESVKGWLDKNKTVSQLVCFRGGDVECVDPSGNFVCMFPKDFKNMTSKDLEDLVFSQIEEC